MAGDWHEKDLKKVADRYYGDTYGIYSLGNKIRSKVEVKKKIDEIDFSTHYFQNLPDNDPRVYDDYKSSLVREEIDKMSIQREILLMCLLEDEIFKETISWLLDRQ